MAVFSIFAAFAYTSGPFPLAYNGLGDVFVFLVFGPLACFGSYFLQTENLNMEIIVCSLALGCLAVNILVVNNLRDLHNDKKVNKNTLAVLLGHEMTRYQYLILALVSFMAPVFLALKNKNPMLFIPLLLLPFAFNLIMEIFQKEDADLNPVLGKTALLQFLFACFFSLGFLL